MLIEREYKEASSPSLSIPLFNLINIIYLCKQKRNANCGIYSEKGAWYHHALIKYRDRFSW